MKRNTWITLPVAWGMACLLAMGAMGAMISGLNLPVENRTFLWLVWAMAGVVGCVCHTLKSRWSALILLVGITGYIILLWKPVTTAMLALLVRVSRIYHAAYGWGVLEVDGLDTTASLAPILGLWGCLIALATTNTVIKGRGLWMTLLLSLLTVGTTVVVIDTPPDAIYLFLVMLAVILLVLTATVRRQDAARGAHLTLLAALPMALLLGGLFLLNPRDAYVNRTQEYMDTVANWWNALPATFVDRTGFMDQTPAAPSFTATTNLTRIGPRRKWGIKIMEVKTTYTDTVYLRGQSYDSYDGNSWDASRDRGEDFGIRDSGWVYRSDHAIEIRTMHQQSLRYLPYYTSLHLLKGGRLENEDGMQSYGFAVTDLPTTIRDKVFPAIDAIYLELPEETRLWAESYIRKIKLDAGISLDVRLTDTAMVGLVVDHVKNSATYSIKTPQMPNNDDDFARWFLEESDTGYCVHFATATAVLLRAAGIPARYVTGYMFPAKTNQVTTVTSDQAHAWVEYYDEYTGAWLIAEATPPDLEGDQPQTQPVETRPVTVTPTEPVPSVEVTAPVTGPVTETQPNHTPGTTPTQKKDLPPLLWLLVIPGLWAGMVAQVRIRRRLQRTDSPNEQALLHWHQVQCICRLTRQTPPEELEELAQKAKFSQHTLTPGELEPFTAWLDTERPKLPFYQTFLCRYILALW